jgi:hypothetical protein
MIAGADAQSIRVIYPNGGELFTADSVITVRWEAPGVSGEVEVEYTVDGGSRWRRIERTQASAGRLTWTVPGRTGTSAQVRVSERRGDASDASDGFFEIAENPLDMMILFFPNGGETLTVGQKHTIRWQAPLDAVDIKLEYTLNGGGQWHTIATVPASPASYEWTVPDVGEKSTSSAFVRMSFPDDAADFDQSDATFAIMPKAVVNPDTAAIALLYPNGGERFVVDSAITISWRGTGLVGTIDVELSRNGGMSWSGIAQVAAGVESISWKVQGDTTAMGLIRLRTGDGGLSDTADALFSIVSQPVTSGDGDNDGSDGNGDGDGSDNDDDDDEDDNDEDDNDEDDDNDDEDEDEDDEDLETQLLAPNGGELWVEGEDRMIRWQAPEDVVTVRLEVSLDGGSSWSLIDTVAATPGEYEWIVPRVADSVVTQAIIKVTDLREEEHFDFSDQVFSLRPLPEIIAGVERGAGRMNLSAVYPNPSAGNAEIRWAQPERGEATLTIFARNGEMVRVERLGMREAGEQRQSLHLGDLSEGVYFYELSIGGIHRHGTMVVVK